jgi:hypothetical protein
LRCVPTGPARRLPDRCIDFLLTPANAVNLTFGGAIGSGGIRFWSGFARGQGWGLLPPSWTLGAVACQDADNLAVTRWLVVALSWAAAAVDAPPSRVALAFFGTVGLTVVDQFWEEQPPGKCCLRQAQAAETCALPLSHTQPTTVASFSMGSSEGMKLTCSSLSIWIVPGGRGAKVPSVACACGRKTPSPSFPSSSMIAWTRGLQTAA